MMTQQELDALVRYVEKHSIYIAKVRFDESGNLSILIPRYLNKMDEAASELEKWFPNGRVEVTPTYEEQLCVEKLNLRDEPTN